MPVSPVPTTTGIQPGYGPYGAIPNVPSPTSTAGTSIIGNIGNLGSLYGLLTQLTSQGASTAMQPLLANLPNYAAMTKQSSENIASNLRGEISPETISALSEGAAERGVAGGFGPGSPNTNASFLRALGLSELELQQLGETQLSGAVARTPVPAPINPLNWLPTAEQQQAAATTQATLGAAPNPAAAAQANQAALMSGLHAGMGAIGAPRGAGGAPSVPAITWAGGAGGPAELGPFGAISPTEPTDPNAGLANWQRLMQSYGSHAPTTVPPATSSDSQLQALGYSQDEIAAMSEDQKTRALAEGAQSPTSDDASLYSDAGSDYSGGEGGG